MVYFIATISFLLLLTVDALELDEITYLPSTYWPMLKYAPSSSSPSSSPLSSARGLNVPFKRQGIIPGPRVGRSFASSYSNDYDHYYHPNDISNVNKFNEYANNYHPELHEISPSSGFKSRGKRSLRVNEMSQSESSASSASPSSSLTGPDMSNIDDSSSSNSMAFFGRSARQLIPAPRVGRSSSSSSSAPLSSNNLLLSSIPSSASNLLTGFSQAANTYSRGGGDDEGNNFETDQQLFNGQVGSLGAHGQIQLITVPRGYLNPILARDLFKRMALTPRIGRSSEGSPSISSGGWFDDDDYYNRVIKSSFTPRVGRSVNVNGEKSSPLKNSKP